MPAPASAVATATEPVVTPEPDTQITPPAPEEPAVTPPPAKPKAEAPPTKKKPPAKKTATKQTNFDDLGSEPVVLVPPSKQAKNQSAAAPAEPVTTAPAVTPEQPATEAANPQKRKTIFDLFNSGSDAGAAATQPAAPATQVASAPTQTKQATAPAATKKAAPAQPQASTGGGYVVQLASFRSDSEAKAEYSRLAGAYPSIIGPLKSQIRQASVGGSTRYQLGLGPLPTRGDATRVCGELIAAGESDCIVRGP